MILLSKSAIDKCPSVPQLTYIWQSLYMVCFFVPVVKPHDTLHLWITERGSWQQRSTCSKGPKSDNADSEIKVECKRSYRRNS